ncbi:Glutaconate CoA-transferase [Desulfobulbus propionicus DSM 2032]|jgi:glutaconate CoA-transferase subunit B|uniref:Glutaconate CoA-transferase n=1 Tax=Desulfobulbus propionicus (strain ATCC 33891 / DSM 2032 / VKM B-1956 / 1pr3) TaxID=577650 RepID=A0A7U3YME4_DESPD|nr:CoA-transferase [Desulfobulbus propionicus]ADW18060.1 Glutaconate CoA-transferase [Desulfobulbus propionicus DSM 2032]
MTVSTDYTAQEIIVVAGSKILEDNKIVFVGTGLPMVASLLAILTHAPGLIVVFEAGAMGPPLTHGLPISVGDSKTGTGASYMKGLNAAFELTQRGYADFGFIGGAEVDMYGNLNSTMMGDYPASYAKPKVRLPGSGGASDMAASCERTILIVPHDKKKFNEKLSYVTSPGHLDGTPGARQKAGMQGKGPYRVITTKGIFDFDEATKRMRILQTFPGETVQSIQDNTGFELLVAPNVSEFAPPTVEEVRLIREVVDPQGAFVKRVAK